MSRLRALATRAAPTAPPRPAKQAAPMARGWLWCRIVVVGAAVVFVVALDPSSLRFSAPAVALEPAGSSAAPPGVPHQTAPLPPRARISPPLREIGSRPQARPHTARTLRGSSSPTSALRHCLAGPWPLHKGHARHCCLRRATLRVRQRGTGRGWARVSAERAQSSALQAGHGRGSAPPQPRPCTRPGDS